MKIRPLNLARLAGFGVAGLAFANSVRAAVIYADDFEGIPVPASPGYLYGASNGWVDSNPTAGNWWYDSAYAAGNNRSLPFGEIALHTKNSYKCRAVDATFEAGVTYRISARCSIDTNNTDGRIFLYIGIDNLGLNDATSLARADFTGAGAIPLGGASFASDTSDWEGAAAGNWGTITLEYVATADDHGRPIAIGVWGNGDSGIDNLVFEDDQVDKFSITAVSFDPETDEVTLTFDSTPDAEYILEHSGDMKSWSEIDDGVPSDGDSTTIKFPSPKGASTARQYFRLRVPD